MLVLVSWPYGRCITVKLCTLGDFFQLGILLELHYMGIMHLFTTKDPEFAWSKIIAWMLLHAHVYRRKLGLCAAFLSNRDVRSHITLTIQNLTYDLPTWSVRTQHASHWENMAFSTAKETMMRLMETRKRSRRLWRKSRVIVILMWTKCNLILMDPAFLGHIDFEISLQGLSFDQNIHSRFEGMIAQLPMSDGIRLLKSLNLIQQA